MKNFFSIFFCLFFVLLANHAAANTLTLTSYYPAPTAAYNQVKLSTNSASSTITMAVQCTVSGTIFIDSTGTLNECTGAGTATTYCTATTNGTLITDSKGTLHVCMNNGTSSIYPQECYNAFCSYDASQGQISCPSPSTCPSGFTNVGISDTFQTSTNTHVTSIVCCTS